MYPSILLELHKHPSNFGTLANPTKSVTLKNPMCGDIIHVDFEYVKGTLKNVAFTGESCAISRASASLLTDTIKGKNISQLKKIDVVFMKTLLGIEVAPARLPCLLLPLEALKKSLL